MPTDDCGQKIQNKIVEETIQDMEDLLLISTNGSDISKEVEYESNGPIEDEFCDLFISFYSNSSDVPSLNIDSSLNYSNDERELQNDEIIQIINGPKPTKPEFKKVEAKVHETDILLQVLHQSQKESTMICYNNQNTIQVMKNLGLQRIMKHIKIKHTKWTQGKEFANQIKELTTEDEDSALKFEELLVGYVDQEEKIIQDINACFTDDTNGVDSSIDVLPSVPDIDSIDVDDSCVEKSEDKQVVFEVMIEDMFDENFEFQGVVVFVKIVTYMIYIKIKLDKL